MQQHKRPRTLEDYVVERELQADKNTGSFSHGVRIVTKKAPEGMEQDLAKYKNPWFLKKSGEADATGFIPPLKAKREQYTEVLAQEFYRLLFPHYPKTRALTRDNDHYVLSKGIKGFQILPRYDKSHLATEFADKVNTKNITGLGSATFLNYFFEDIDFKYNNVGLDDQNRIIKIDAGWSFVSIKNFTNKPFNITESGIKALPLPSGIFVYNWLDSAMDGKRYYPQCITPSMALDGHPVRQEINQAMLGLLLLPRVMIKKFIDAYIPAADSLNQTLYDLLETKITQLKSVALNNLSFKKYLTSPSAAEDFKNYLNNFKNFKTTGKYFIIGKDINLEARITQKFAELKSPLKAKPVIRASKPFFSNSIHRDDAFNQSKPKSKKEVVPVEMKILHEINPPPISNPIPPPFTLPSGDDVKNVLSAAIHNKVRKMQSLLTFRDKTLEKKRNLIWLTMEKNIHSLNSAFELFVTATIEDVNITKERFRENNKKIPSQLDLGKIYEKVASKLYELNPAAFKEVILKIAIHSNCPNLETFCKNVYANGKQLTAATLFTPHDQSTVLEKIDKAHTFEKKR